MAATIFPLVYKPGISRDGTNFQSQFCTDGQWIRFQRGKVKKIGGLYGFTIQLPTKFFTNLLILPSPNDNNIYVYAAYEDGIKIYIASQDFKLVQELPNIAPVNAPNILWQSVVIIVPVTQANAPPRLEKRIIFMGTNNRININDSSAPIFKTRAAYANGTADTDTFVNVSPKSNGGLCYSAPHLFIYGENGIVQYSKSNNPFDFTVDVTDPATGGELNIAPETGAKVIYGKAIRGGTNSPSVLFWTTSSVVRITNVGDQFTNFKRDVLSQSSSILSSRSVVEYDGTFFWIGTDRFFVFNGIVQELANTTNLNFFFDNLDMARRQQVFGVKNTRYGEIWWFYPEIGRGGNYNTRAIIYNKRENSWYDTAITRDCGMYSEEFGFMATLGNGGIGDPDNYIFRHEVLSPSQRLQKIAGGGRILTNNPITSYVVTPVFSWAAFNPMNQMTGVDRWMTIKRLEPDFVVNESPAAPNIITVTVQTLEYPQSLVSNSDPVTFQKDTSKIDLDVHGRHMQLKFQTQQLFEMGHNMMLLSIGDGQ